MILIKPDNLSSNEKIKSRKCNDYLAHVVKLINAGTGTQDNLLYLVNVHSPLLYHRIIP